MSAAGRRRIAAATKARWAAYRKAKAAPKKEPRAAAGPKETVKVVLRKPVAKKAAAKTTVAKPVVKKIATKSRAKATKKPVAKKVPAVKPNAASGSRARYRRVTSAGNLRELTRASRGLRRPQVRCAMKLQLVPGCACGPPNVNLGAST